MRISTYLILGLFTFSTLDRLQAQDIDLSKKGGTVEAIENQINAYMKKSRSQKKIAWILLGGGLALNVASTAIISNNNYDPAESNSGAVMSGISGLAYIGSIPLFFASSRNKNKAQLLAFRKGFALANSDEERKIYLEDAVAYLSGRGRANTTTGVVLSAVAGVSVIAGLVISGKDGPDGVSEFIGDVLVGPVYIVGGIMCGLASIPFYVRGAHLNRKAKMILKTGRFPTMELGHYSPTIRMGRQFSVGIAVQL